VLDLVVPDASGGDVGDALLDQWPIYLGYVVSFASIGASWLAHSVITEYLRRADSIVLRLNLLLLFFVALLPFPTRMLANFVHDADAERIAVTVYGVNLLAMAAVTSIVWHYAASADLVERDSPDDDVEAVTAKVAPSLLLSLGAIGIGLLAPRVAVVLYLAIALYVMIPFRAIARWLRRRGDS
jgi:uncharacterized membrane protein